MDDFLKIEKLIKDTKKVAMEDDADKGLAYILEELSSLVEESKKLVIVKEKDKFTSSVYSIVYIGEQEDDSSLRWALTDYETSLVERIPATAALKLIESGVIGLGYTSELEEHNNFVKDHEAWLEETENLEDEDLLKMIKAQAAEGN